MATIAYAAILRGAQDSAIIASETERYWTAFTSGDADNAGVFMGEAAGLIHDVRPAAEIIEAMVAQAHGLLRRAGRFVVSG
jgi:nitronate monooxygenase